MCFVLFIGSPRPLPIIPWDSENRALNTALLTGHERDVAGLFHQPHVYCIGSDTQCGCGYRHVDLQNGTWPGEEWRPFDGGARQEDLDRQPNHEALVRFVREHLSDEEFFELYGIWEGGADAFSEPPLSDQKIPLERILEPDFYFRERGRYTVTRA